MAWYNVQKGQNVGISGYMTWEKEERRENNIGVVEVGKDMKENEVSCVHVLLQGENDRKTFVESRLVVKITVIHVLMIKEHVSYVKIMCSYVKINLVSNF